MVKFFHPFHFPLLSLLIRHLLLSRHSRALMEGESNESVCKYQQDYQHQYDHQPKQEPPYPAELQFVGLTAEQAGQYPAETSELILLPVNRIYDLLAIPSRINGGSMRLLAAETSPPGSQTFGSYPQAIQPGESSSSFPSNLPGSTSFNGMEVSLPSGRVTSAHTVALLSKGTSYSLRRA